MELNKELKKIELISKSISHSLIGGNYKSLFKGHGVDFSDIREYNYADDVRFINWSVSSKNNSTYINILTEDRQVNIFLIVDVSNSMQNHMVSGIVKKIYSLLTYSAFANNDCFGSLFFDLEVKKFINLSKGKNHFYKLYEYLLKFQNQYPKSGSNIDLAVKEFLIRIKKKSIVFVISDFNMVNYENNMKMLSNFHDVILIKIDNYYHHNFPNIGYVKLKDNETGELLNSFGLSRNFKNEFERYYLDRLYSFNKFCKKYKIDSVVINYNDNPYKKIIDFFKLRTKK